MSVSSVGSTASVGFHGQSVNLEQALDATVRDLQSHLNMVQVHLRTIAATVERDDDFAEELEMSWLRPISFLFLTQQMKRHYWKNGKSIGKYLRRNCRMSTPSKSEKKGRPRNWLWKRKSRGMSRWNVNRDLGPAGLWTKNQVRKSGFGFQSANMHFGTWVWFSGLDFWLTLGRPTDLKSEVT